MLPHKSILSYFHCPFISHYYEKKASNSRYTLKQLLANSPNLNKYSISFNAHKVLHSRIKNEGISFYKVVKNICSGYEYEEILRTLKEEITIHSKRKIEMEIFLFNLSKDERNRTKGVWRYPFFSGN